MEPDNKGQIQQNSLLTDEHYYRNIFKKTEKIVSAVFFILSKTTNIPPDHVVRSDLERRSKDTHSVALSILNMEPEAASYAMQTLFHSFVSLDSILSIFAAMGGISSANLQVLRNEIDSVQRAMRHYLSSAHFTVSDVERLAPVAERTSRASRSVSTAPTVAAGAASSGGISRTDRIVSFLRDNAGASVGDIHTVVSDCSEKTIQRELMSLIDKGLVRKEGERRWSRYFLV